MDKQAALQDIYNAAFEDEMQKVSGIGQVAGKAWGALAGSAKGLVEGVKRGVKNIGYARKGGPVTDLYKREAKNAFISAGRKGALALGTGAAAVGGGIAGGNAIFGQKRD